MNSLATQTRDRLVAKSQAANEQGFTLIETAIALVVMMVIALASAALFAYAVNNNSASYDRTMAIAVAQQHLERLRKCPFNEVVSANEPDMTSAGHHFSVVTTVTGTTLKTITVTVTPTSARDEWARNPLIVMSQRSALGKGAFY
jgi:Tfp pilus assembly protein PilV